MTRSSTAQRARQQSGEDTEALVDQLADTHALARVAVFRKRATPKAVRAGKAVYLASPGVDYTGHLRGGRALYFDVKRSQRGDFSFSVIRDVQREELARAHDDGALAFVLVVAGPVLVAATLHLVPWDAIVSLERVGRVSMSRTDLEAFARPRPLFLEGLR